MRSAFNPALPEDWSARVDVTRGEFMAAMETIDRLAGIIDAQRSLLSTMEGLVIQQNDAIIRLMTERKKA